MPTQRACRVLHSRWLSDLAAAMSAPWLRSLISLFRAEHGRAVRSVMSRGHCVKTELGRLTNQRASPAVPNLRTRARYTSNDGFWR